MKKKLYLVKSRGFRAYVVAEDTNSAWEKFKAWLDCNDYGYFWDRDFGSIELVASEDTHSLKTESGNSFDDNRKDDKLFL